MHAVNLYVCKIRICPYMNTCLITCVCISSYGWMDGCMHKQLHVHLDKLIHNHISGCLCGGWQDHALSVNRASSPWFPGRSSHCVVLCSTSRSLTERLYKLHSCGNWASLTPKVLLFVRSPGGWITFVQHQIKNYSVGRESPPFQN